MINMIEPCVLKVIVFPKQVNGSKQVKNMKPCISVMMCKFSTLTGQTSSGNKHEASHYYTMHELHGV